MSNIPTINDIRNTERRIRQHIHRTPVLTCNGINRMVGGEIYFKCENFQKVGAFKFRGAANAVFSLSDQEASRGVATHSSGNHAAALALAARSRGIQAYVVMPENAPQVKKDAVAGYGAQITVCPPTLEDREKSLDQVVERTGAAFIHPYDDYRIIAGQATATMELLETVPNLDVIMTPIGGGGLTSGTALAVRYLSPNTRMVAVEPYGADDAYRSFQTGRLVPSENPRTIADGLLTSLGEKTYPIVRDYVDHIVRVTEDGIIAAMRTIWERMKIVVEPSAAVPLAALLTRCFDMKGRRVGIILSGGNVDLDRLPWLNEAGLGQPFKP
ncbi:MAG: pyridoxal-phosphate dependent enzyme [Desulfobacteraceae bacterium]|nr:pyridoxal-phosphate dependent enzyme [Desulfobacteraceae bacterium]